MTHAAGGPRRVVAVLVAGVVLAAIAVVFGTAIARADGETVSVGDVTVLEAPAGKTVTLKFSVALSAPRTTTTKISYATSDGSATAGSDYASKSGTVSIGAGKTTATITVTGLGDGDAEGVESFSVNLTGVVTAGVILGDDTGVGTFIDDDPDVAPSVSVGDVSVVEGNGGTRTATVGLRLSAPLPTDTEIGYQTIDGSAVSPTDYKSKIGVAKIKAGKVAANISITTYPNTTAQPDRAFDVTLTGSSAPITDGTGTISIVDDDGDPSGVSIGDVVVAEGDNGKANAGFIVSLSEPATALTEISYQTVNGSASAPLDFKAKTGTLKIPAGKAMGKISVSVFGDTLHEGDEQFSVQLTHSTGAAIVDGSGTATIVDDAGDPSGEEPVLG